MKRRLRRCHLCDALTRESPLIYDNVYCVHNGCKQMKLDQLEGRDEDSAEEARPVGPCLARRSSKALLRWPMETVREGSWSGYDPRRQRCCHCMNDTHGDGRYCCGFCSTSDGEEESIPEVCCGPSMC